jgi:uncharacterized protein YegJ (DUF2314 family)
MQPIAVTLALILSATTATPDHVVRVSHEDREMNGAIAKARATLNTFLRTYSNPPEGATRFSVKVKVTDSNGTDHLWIEPFRKTPNGFSGTVANAPDQVKNVSKGAEISFKRADITDWSYTQDDKREGGFTVCVMLKRISADDAQAYRRESGIGC